MATQEAGERLLAAERMLGALVAREQALTDELRGVRVALEAATDERNAARTALHGEAVRGLVPRAKAAQVTAPAPGPAKAAPPVALDEIPF
jgi:hypothetical protein